MDWHSIEIGLAINWFNIVNGLVPKLCMMGGLLDLDLNRIDLKLHYIYTSGIWLGNPIGFGMIMD